MRTSGAVPALLFLLTAVALEFPQDERSTFVSLRKAEELNRFTPLDSSSDSWGKSEADLSRYSVLDPSDDSLPLNASDELKSTRIFTDDAELNAGIGGAIIGAGGALIISSLLNNHNKDNPCRYRRDVSVARGDNDATNATDEADDAVESRIIGPFAPSTNCRPTYPYKYYQPPPTRSYYSPSSYQPASYPAPSYQPASYPSYQSYPAPSYPSYPSTSYPAPAPSYPAPPPSYPAPSISYPPVSYPAPAPSYPSISYPAPAPSYLAPAPSYPSSAPTYTSPASYQSFPSPAPAYQSSPSSPYQSSASSASFPAPSNQQLNAIAQQSPFYQQVPTFTREGGTVKRGSPPSNGLEPAWPQPPQPQSDIARPLYPQPDIGRRLPPSPLDMHAYSGYSPLDPRVSGANVEAALTGSNSRPRHYDNVRFVK